MGGVKDICNKFGMETQRMDILLPHYTYEDYCQWEGRWELICGIPFAMSPLPVPEHQRVGGRLFTAFDQALSGLCDHCTAYPPIDWKVKDDTVLQPDFLVVCNEVKKPYIDFPPALVAEILSPSTSIKDRNTKFNIYQSQGVKYYLIFDARQKKLELYELVDDQYKLVSENPSSFHFTFHDTCSVSVPLDYVWE